MTRWLKWAPLALALAALTCGGAPGPPSPEESTAAVEESPSPKIEAVPEIAVVPPNQAAPFPYPAGGLAFQRADSAAATVHKPIGTALFGPNAWLYASFPNLDLIIAFRPPQFDLVFFGARGKGGADEIVKDPERLWLRDQRLWLTNQANGQAIALDLEGRFQDMQQLQAPDPIPGPNGDFLAVSPNNLNVFMRVNNRSIPQRVFQLPTLPDEGADSSRRHFQIFEDWSLATIADRGAYLFELAENGAARRYFRIDWAASRPFASRRPTIHGLKRAEGRYWLLLDGGAPRAPAFILGIDADSGDALLWQTPFPADGFDFNGDFWMLYRRQSGAIQTYRRR